MLKLTGFFLFLAGLLILMGMTTAEIFYPISYSLANNTISNLGATKPPHSIIYQPSAYIFDTSMILAGLFIILASYSLYKVVNKKLESLFIFVMGIGSAGVGIFPVFHIILHSLFAYLAFFCGGISIMLSFNFVKSPFKLIILILGLVSLIFLFLGLIVPQLVIPILGRGGTERFVAYPIIIWLISFGGYIMNTN